MLKEWMATTNTHGTQNPLPTQAAPPPGGSAASTTQLQDVCELARCSAADDGPTNYLATLLLLFCVLRGGKAISSTRVRTLIQRRRGKLGN